MAFACMLSAAARSRVCFACPASQHACACVHSRNTAASCCSPAAGPTCVVTTSARQRMSDRLACARMLSAPARRSACGACAAAQHVCVRVCARTAATPLPFAADLLQKVHNAGVAAHVRQVGACSACFLVLLACCRACTALAAQQFKCSVGCRHGSKRQQQLQQGGGVSCHGQGPEAAGRRG